MMELSQIQQYSHKIIKVTISNKNQKSSYDYVTVKVHLDRETNETIRFSLTKTPAPNEWFEHQSFDNDYFLRIPNKLSNGKEDGITEIYAHYFPADLYDYTEANEIFSIYDFSDFIKDTQTNQWDGMEYPLQINSYGYEMLIGYDNKPLIRSLLTNSITRYKDPNYKNYIKTDITKNISDMTEKGRFPLSSRYRNSLYRTAPNLNDNQTYKLPYWRADTTMYSHGASPENATSVDTSNTVEEGYKYEDGTATSSYTNKYGSDDNCNKRSTKIPYWEAKIHRSGISPIIGDVLEDEDEQFPINVYLNYQYLPTSTEYHQHYFGFEGHNLKTTDGANISRESLITAVETYLPDKNNIIRYDAEVTEQLRKQLHDYCEKIKNGTYRQITTNRTFEVLDGEGLIDVHQDFVAPKIWVCKNCDYEEKYEEGKEPSGTCPQCQQTNSFILQEDRTYRLINHGDPFKTNHSFYLKHKNIYDINLDSITITDNCLWEKNGCPNETNSLPYWTYTPTGEGAAYLNVTLKAHTPYVLKYFMYIPDDAYIEDDSCYIEVQSRVGEKTETIGELHQSFKDQDKKLRHQWVYHEIPFYTREQNNRIVIKGPQHNHEGVIGINRLTNEIITQITDEVRNNPNIELHDCKNDLIHFYSIQIAEMVEYSPTMKYTENGFYLTEGSKYAKKPLEDYNKNTCENENNATNQWATQEALNPSDTWINKGTTRLPIPLTDIYIFFDNDFSIIYNQLSTELSYTKGNFPFKFNDFNESFDECLTWLTDDSEICLQYDKVTTPLDEAQSAQTAAPSDADKDINQLLLAELKLFNRQYKFFTSGINNNFTLQLQDAYGNPITTGQVECSIWTSNHEDTTPCSEAERCLGIQEPDEYGKIAYEHLNFKNFKPQRHKYYLRIRYINSCYKKDIVKWKELLFVDEYRNIDIYTNTCDKKVCLNTSDCCSLVAKSYFNETSLEYQKQSYIYTVTSVEFLPLRLDVKIRSQPLNGNQGNIIDEGYCELSINDEVIQTTFVDENGVADFYLDENDLEPGQQIIKVEYFTHPYESINFVYFPILCDTEQGYDERPAIPIMIKKLTGNTVEQLTTNLYEIEKDDIFFVDIDTENCKDFSITIIRNNTIQEVININEVMNRSYVITAMYGTDEYKNPTNRSFLNTHLKDSNNRDIDKYVIITGNIKDENGSDITDKYRTTKKEFTLLWKDS